MDTDGPTETQAPIILHSLVIYRIFDQIGTKTNISHIYSIISLRDRSL